MASVTEKTPPDSPPKPAERTGEPLVDQHIRRTRSALKLVDFIAGFITLAIGVLVFLLVVAVLEHWVLPGGWSDTARSLLFGSLILGVGGYCWRTFWPLLRQSINPVYAAQAIEQSSPSLKNSLLNLILLRNRKRLMSRQVLQAIEQQAAQRLSSVRLDSVVDRSAIVRLGYLLVAITAICVLYRLFSPKDLISSAGRVLMPWSSIATPSRVQIVNVTPGDAKAARGERLQISAEVFGLETDEPVRLFYSTADKQIVRAEIAMSDSTGGADFRCRVPGRGGHGGGIQQDFTYWIEAGDARSPRYDVAVFARPTLVVTRLRYEYPAYTGIPSREVEHTGDLRAIEGTNVTLFAQANKPIKAAHVDFEADGHRNLLMNSSDQQATVTFPLALREDRRTPQHQSYVLRYLTTSGNQNQKPPKYKIDVQPDYSPEIQLLFPEEAVLEVALNQEVNFELEARDPDYALSQVVLLGKVGEEPRLQEKLLARNHTGRFVGKLRKTPAEMGLQVGEVMEYWGAAADNRHPQANLAYSAHRKLRVVDPWQGDSQGEKNQDGEGQQQGGGGDPQEGDGGQQGQAGAGESGNSGEDEQSEQGESGKGQESGDQGENNKQQKGQGESASADGPHQPNDSQNNDSQQGAGGDSPAENSDNSPQQNEGDQHSEDPSAGKEGGEQGKVSSDGDDDSSVFERMAEHFNEQPGKGEDGTTSSEGSSEGKAADGSPESDSPGEPGEQGESGKDPETGETGENNEQQKAQGESASAEGQPQPSDSQNGEGEQQKQGEQSPDGKMSPEQGEPGAGDRSGDEQGTPDPEGAKNSQDKQGNSSDGAEQADSEAASKANDQAESDSEGSQGGDRSGGGQEGAGQQADADGKGGAGEHQAADDGAGQASETGEGETGEKSGDQKQAEGKTGESSGDKPGEGSQQGEQTGEQQGGDETSQQGANEGAKTGEPPSTDAQGQPANPTGGTSGNTSSPPPEGEAQPGDDANLDYARKQTDLILDRLENQLNKQDVDKSLLEKLGWTQDELRRFVDRWKNLKTQADANPDSAEASQKLNEALRSLGLGRKRRTGYQSKIAKDKLRDLRDAYRGRVPLEYQEQVSRYLKGTATAEEE